MKTPSPIRKSPASSRWMRELEACWAILPQGALVLGPKGEIARMNDGARDILGFAADEPSSPAKAKALPPIRLLENPLEPPGASLAERVLGGEIIRRVEAFLRRPDGREVPVRVTGTPVIGPGEAVRSALLILEDLSELDAIHQDAMRHVNEMARTLDSINEGVIVYGPGGEILRVNATARRVLGRDFETWQGLPPVERNTRLRVETEDAQPLTTEASPLLRALKGETVYGFPLRLHLSSGRTMHLLSTVTPMHDDEGRINSVLGTYTDVTRLYDLLHLRDEIASVVAHDLRQPLSAILTNAEVVAALIRGGHGDSAAEIADSIARGAARMNAIIEDLVDGIRLEAGRIELKPRPLALEERFRDLVQRMFTPSEAQRLRIEVEDALPKLVADPDRLDRIVVNLLTNAIKYAEPDTPVELRARVEGPDIVIEVRDRGPGIKPEEIPLIFERFYRSEKPDKTQGLGLGLYISRILTEAHGGRIWVESEVGKGSTFFVALPIRRESSDRESPPGFTSEPAG